jgi:hypothetical protein
MADEVGKEPGNWELYRGIERVEQTLKEISANSLSAAVFAIEKAGIQGQIASLAEHQVAQDAQAKADRESNAKYQQAQEDQKNKNRLLMYGMFGGPIVAIVVTFVATGGLTS